MSRRPAWAPTHNIVGTSPQGIVSRWSVMLIDGAGYTEIEWESCIKAAWRCGRDGHWNYLGMLTPWGASGQVLVERVR